MSAHWRRPKPRLYDVSQIPREVLKAEGELIEREYLEKRRLADLPSFNWRKRAIQK